MGFEERFGVWNMDMEYLLGLKTLNMMEFELMESNMVKAFLLMIKE